MGCADHQYGWQTVTVTLSLTGDIAAATIADHSPEGAQSESDSMQAQTVAQLLLSGQPLEYRKLPYVAHNYGRIHAVHQVVATTEEPMPPSRDLSAQACVLV
jgi:hypothetical protein